MRKLKLSLEGLRIESFEVTKGETARRGTVQGHTGVHPCLPYSENPYDTVNGMCFSKVSCYTGEDTMCEYTLWTCPPECYQER